MKTIFYSWQSDRPNKTNRTFIEDAINKSIKKVATDLKLQIAERKIDIQLDKDTKDTPGIPPITETIFLKISNSLLFIPDLTFVGKTTEGRLLPNPNVLIEYGYALKSLSHHKIVPVMNTSFGDIDGEALPFDMRHLRHPITYCLEEGTGMIERSQVKEELVKRLAKQIHLVIKQDTPDSKLIPSVDPLTEKRNRFQLFCESQEYKDLSANEQKHGFIDPKQALPKQYIAISFLVISLVIGIYNLLKIGFRSPGNTILVSKLSLLNFILIFLICIVCILVIYGISKQAKILKNKIQNGEAIVRIFSVHIFPVLVVNVARRHNNKYKQPNESCLITLQTDPKDPNSFLEIEQSIGESEKSNVRFFLYEIGIIYSKKMASSTQYVDILEFSRTKNY